MALHPRFGGSVWMGEITPAFGSVVRSFGEKGCLEASFSYSLPPNVRHPAMRVGKMLELVGGGGVDWAGIVTEIDRKAGVVHARGYAAEAASFAAVNGSGNPTSNPRTAGTQAVARGWNVSIDTSIPNANYTTEANTSNTVQALWDAQATEDGKYWWVDEFRVARMGAAPSTPVWQIPPGVVDLGSVDDNYYSALRIQYLSSATVVSSVVVTDTVAAGLFGYREELIDATELGVISSGRATSIGNGLVTLGRSRLGWTEGFELNRFQLQTLGCEPADLSRVRSLQSVRIHGIDEDRQVLFGRPYLDCVIGGVSWVDGSPTIQVSPIGAVSKTASDVIADMAGRAA